MLKTVLFIAIVLVIAIGGGAGSVWLALEQTHTAGSIEIGAWTVFPDAGTRDADPYSRARTARAGELVLGRAEGITFIADEDDTGAVLLRQCGYTISGAVPAVRFFTLRATDEAGRPLAGDDRFPTTLHSRMLLRPRGAPLTITVAPRAHPGNWLATAGTGPMRLVLTLFDTPISTGERLDEIALPRIGRLDCDG